MCQVLVLTLLGLVAATHQTIPPTLNQLPTYRNKTQGQNYTWTTSSGAPIASKYTGSTLNTPLYENPCFMDKIFHFIYETTPQRIVHMKGAGAFGYFKTTHDITNTCLADIFKAGTTTPVGVRFSVGVTDKGGPDTTATPFGMAIKMYTTQGILDLLGLHTPCFALNDPMRFSDFVHCLRPNPVTNMADPNPLWDYVGDHPEAVYMLLMLYGGKGIPSDYRHMAGYPIHTFQVYNANGTSSFIRYHFIPADGFKYMDSTTAASNACSNLDYYSADLYTAIANGNYPKWNLSVQIMTLEDIKWLKQNYSIDAFDTSNVVPVKLCPLQPVGQLVLNKNPTNYHEEIEQMAFNPTNYLPGMLGSPGTVFQARSMIYRPAQVHRLGSNYNNIPVNCPIKGAYTYNRDGVAPFNSNDKEGPDYYPNVFNGPKPYEGKNIPSLLQIHQDEPNNFAQAQEYYLTEMSEEDRGNFVKTIISTLCYTPPDVQERAVKSFGKVHPDLGKNMADELKANNC